MKVVVFTTIYPSTEAVAAWARVGDRTFVVGDRKTPEGWSSSGCTFLPADGQSGDLSDALPWNHYCRKNLGYVEAIRAGATVIVDTDDDNMPKTGWDVPAFDGEYRVVKEAEFANVYQLFNPVPGDVLWPRGYPLDRIWQPGPFVSKVAAVRVGVWQGLADGDPDVDAIWRMTRSSRYVRFCDDKPVVLAFGTVCPFNSQNTVFRKETFPLLYLPAVDFRFTDILRGLVAQPIMWSMGYSLGFTGATVVQDRNPHDIMSDFASEIRMYLCADKIHRIVQEAVRPEYDISDNLRIAYAALHAHGIVDDREEHRLNLWLRMIS